MNITATAIAEPACIDFLKIGKIQGEYMRIDEFIQQYSNLDEDELNKCYIIYREVEKTYEEYGKEYSNLARSMELLTFNSPLLIVNSSIKISIYFMKKAIECLEFARFFTLKSALLLDIDYNVRWSEGYVPQFFFRCIYFGTATTWYSNAFDHLLQALYWGKELYKSVKDKDGNTYEDSWRTERILKLCNYQFVEKELGIRRESKALELVKECCKKIGEVRKWSNYIKHKGGLDYQYLEAASPFVFFEIPSVSDIAIEEGKNVQNQRLSQQHRIEDFKSPVKIDIDLKKTELVEAYKVIHDCVESMINYIGYEKYAINK